MFTPSDDADRGAHGPFDDSAWTIDPQLWLSTRRRGLLAGTAARAAAVGGVLAARRSG